MKNFVSFLKVSHWVQKRKFIGKLIFGIFPDYIRGSTLTIPLTL
jgi:hypothetical protein